MKNWSQYLSKPTQVFRHVLSKSFNLCFTKCSHWYGHKWFGALYLLGIVFFTFLWSFVSCGRDEFRVRGEGNKDCYVSSTAEYQTLEYNKHRDHINLKKKFGKRTAVVPLLEMGSEVLVDLPDGQRVWTDMESVHNLTDKKLERLNFQYSHKYISDFQTELVGKKLDDLVDKYGEYAVHTIDGNVHKYYFPQIWIYKGYKKNTDGVVFETGADGVVSKAYLWKPERTYFEFLSIFPFYKQIISWNLAYNKMAYRTVLHEKGGVSVPMALVNLLLALLIGMVLAMFPLFILIHYICRFVYDRDYSNVSIKYWISVPYIIISYIHVLSMTDAVNGNYILVLALFVGVAMYVLRRIHEFIDWNRCSHCHRVNVLEVIDSQVVDSKIESETHSKEEVDEPCDNKERYVKVTKRYKVHDKTYIDIVQSQLICSSCQKITVLKEAHVRRYERDKQLMETETVVVKRI